LCFYVIFDINIYGKGVLLDVICVIVGVDMIFEDGVENGVGGWIVIGFWIV